MPELQNRKQADAYRFLLASVIERAIDDLKGIGLKCNGFKCRKVEMDEAMAFILSDTCEAWCLELKIDYERIREKAVELYQRFIAKTDKKPARKKRTVRPAKPIERGHVRKAAGKPRISTNR